MLLPPLIPGKVVRREKRFRLFVEINDRIELAYLPNSGRLGELIYPGAEVFLKKRSGENRKTSYEAVLGVQNGVFVSINASLANDIFLENLGKMPFKVDKVRREFTFQNSRYDFLINDDLLIEVKSCTLVEDGVGLFPDAPTIRGTKHLLNLLEWPGKRGLVFVIQREDANYFSPNIKMDPEFSDAYLKIIKSADFVLAFTCKVNLNSITFKKFVPIKWSKI